MKHRNGALVGALLVGTSLGAFSGPAAALDLEAMKAEQGVKVHRTPDAVLQAQLAAWDKVIAANQDPFFQKVIESQKSFAKRVVQQ